MIIANEWYFKKMKQTPLLIALDENGAPLIDYYKMINLLIESGANVNQDNNIKLILIFLCQWFLLKIKGAH